MMPRVTPKKRNLYSSLAQPIIFDGSLTNSTHGKQRRANHNSVLNFSDGSQLRRSSIDPSNKSSHVPISASGERQSNVDHSKTNSHSKRLPAANNKSSDRNNIPNFMMGGSAMKENR